MFTEFIRNPIAIISKKKDISKAALFSCRPSQEVSQTISKNLQKNGMVMFWAKNRTVFPSYC